MMPICVSGTFNELNFQVLLPLIIFFIRSVVIKAFLQSFDDVIMLIITSLLPE